MKKWICAAAAVVALTIGVWRLAPTYSRLMALRLAHSAEAARKKGDFAAASRFYALAVQRDPDNLGVLRAWADLLAANANPDLIAVRGRIWQLDQKCNQCFLDYVEALIMFRQHRAARRLLSRAPNDEIRATARYYHLLGVALHLSGQLPEADAAATEAVKRDPTSGAYKVNQAIIRLACPDPSFRKGAIEMLESCLDDPKLRLKSLQALLNYATLAPAEPERLGKWLEIAARGMTPQDFSYPAYLSALRRWRANELEPALAKYLQANDPKINGIETMQWMVANGLYDRALNFRQSFPAEMQVAPECLSLTAEAMFQLGNWERLASFLEDSAWTKEPTLQLAWAERLRRAREPQAGGGLAAWHRVLSSAGEDQATLLRLEETIAQWKWPEENIELLWTIVDRLPRFSDSALDDLSNIYLARQDGAGLLRVLDRQAEKDPDNAAISNNIAFLSFLLNRNPEKAEHLSDEILRRYPKSPVFVATAAFGHLTRGEISEGLKLFENVDVKALVGTAPGVTYGMLLAANGDRAAAAYLQDAERWLHFPEERQLVANARKQIGA